MEHIMVVNMKLDQVIPTLLRLRCHDAGKQLVLEPKKIERLLLNPTLGYLLVMLRKSCMLGPQSSIIPSRDWRLVPDDGYNGEHAGFGN
jgi:hypothetical protein